MGKRASSKAGLYMSARASRYWLSVSLLTLASALMLAKGGIITEYQNPEACEGEAAATYNLDTDCFQGFSTDNFHRIECTGERGEARNYIWPASRGGCSGSPEQVEVYVPGCNLHMGVVEGDMVYNYSASLMACPGEPGSKRYAALRRA